ncbi:hypothetical protein GCM10009682_35280 [Luedemannella flava]|uniref:YtxH domain-containing protein n=1 Tax=Luedemannella flava TaxID=349316 RepID=A0ABP4YE96_9ACTN
MRLLTLAAGVAVGYVLGTRAGREKYDKIVEGARNLADQPPVVQAKHKIQEIVGAGTDAAGRKLNAATDAVTHKLDTVAASKKSPGSTVTTP